MGFRCPACPRTYKQRSSLMRHRAVAHGGRRHACHCGCSFTQTTALLRHQRAVHDAVRHTCECERSFTSADALRKHVQTHHWTPDQRRRAGLGGWCTACWQVQLGYHTSFWDSKRCAECSGVLSTQRYFLKFVAHELGEQWMPSSLDNVVLGGCDGLRRRRPDVGFLFLAEDGRERFVDLEVDEDGHVRRDAGDESLKVEDTARALPGVDFLMIRAHVPSSAPSEEYAALAQRVAKSLRSAISEVPGPATDSEAPAPQAAKVLRVR